MWCTSTFWRFFWSLSCVRSLFVTIFFMPWDQFPSLPRDWQCNTVPTPNMLRSEIGSNWLHGWKWQIRFFLMWSFCYFVLLFAPSSVQLTKKKKKKNRKKTKKTGRLCGTLRHWRERSILQMAASGAQWKRVEGQRSSMARRQDKVSHFLHICTSYTTCV